MSVRSPNIPPCTVHYSIEALSCSGLIWVPLSIIVVARNTDHPVNLYHEQFSHKYFFELSNNILWIKLAAVALETWLDRLKDFHSILASVVLMLVFSGRNLDILLWSICLDILYPITLSLSASLKESSAPVIFVHPHPYWKSHHCTILCTTSSCSWYLHCVVKDKAHVTFLWQETWCQGTRSWR